MDAMMTMDVTEKRLLTLYRELRSEMAEHILPFWINRLTDNVQGGYFGQVLNDETIIPDSPKGAVLNARILWTFSAVYNLTGESTYLTQAGRAFDYFSKYFVDPQYGGIYWSVNADGSMLDGHKQIYAQAFGIYALAEYYMASGDQDSILLASDLYGYIEKYASDNKKNGYIEALSREWKPMDDLRLSDKDANEPKSMNTHLHILEAYTRLYEVWKDEELGNRLMNLVEIHRDKILSARSGHFNLFFDMDWNPKSEHYSFGHDIEGAWLLTEAARQSASREYVEQVEALAVTMAAVTLREGVAPDGSLYNEGLQGRVTDTDRHWWPQAEAIVGFLNAWEISGNPDFLIAAENAWHFIKSHMRHPSGEWWWLVNDNYQPDMSQDLAGAWKCPYHNTRCCLEIMKRVSAYFRRLDHPELITSITEEFEKF